MKDKFLTITLVALIVVNVLDGDFQNPSALDYVKFAIIGVALVLNLIGVLSGRSGEQ